MFFLVDPYSTCYDERAEKSAVLQARLLKRTWSVKLCCSAVRDRANRAHLHVSRLRQRKSHAEGPPPERSIVRIRRVAHKTSARTRHAFLVMARLLAWRSVE